MTDVVTTLRRNRLQVMSVFDVACWLGAFAFVIVLRLEGFEAIPWAAAAAVGLVSGLLHLLVGGFLRLHQGRARTASLEEFLLLAFVIGLVGVVVFAANLAGLWLPRSVPVGAAFICLVFAATGRALWRRLKERDDEQLHSEGSARVLLIGAGDAAHDLVVSMLRDPAKQYRPVGMLDDDPHKRHRRIRRVPVLGRTAEVDEAVERYDVEVVVIAIPSADAATVRRLARRAGRTGAEVKVLPATSQLLSHQVGIRDIRDINLTDVLGRNQIDTDITAIADYLTGRRVLVTGAGGSIGSELCRQINRFNPSELMMLDRDESALHAVQLSIHGRALLDSDDVILCDIRDTEALRDVFAARRPEVVFHAAALKHLPMLEQYPGEAVKTNVVGTVNVLEASRGVGVDTFVNISTDKAANPASVLGYSKRVAERVTAQYAAEASEGTYLSVRFGNVLGSRGSVLTSFAQQIASGGPVTVTHPDVTRYFMTIEEACQLVVQAAAIGRPGEALVLDMGDPIKILDVAEQLISESHHPIEVEFTGLRPGEKLHEELFGDDEPQHVRPEHPMVSHVPVPRVSDEDVRRVPMDGDPLEITRALAGLCLTMTITEAGHPRN